VFAWSEDPQTATAPPKWNIYKNKEHAFCFEYPRTWDTNEPMTKNGLLLTPPRSQGFRLPSSIQFGIQANQPSEADERRLRTLDENFKAAMKGLRESARPTILRVLEKQALKWAGRPALLYVVEHQTPASAEPIYSRTMTLLTDRGWIIFVELRCSVNDSKRLLPVFTRLQESLRLNCR
jgi:hypothetical protein